MIRRRLRSRWRARLPEPRGGAAVLCAMWELDHWTWLDRYFDWSVRVHGEIPELLPWWDRIAGRFCCWLADWRTTLALRFGRRYLDPGSAEWVEARVRRAARDLEERVVDLFDEEEDDPDGNGAA